MTLSPVCILYSQDGDLPRRVKAFLRTMAQVRHVAEPDRLEAVLQQVAPAVVIMDLRAKEYERQCLYSVRFRLRSGRRAPQ